MAQTIEVLSGGSLLYFEKYHLYGRTKHVCCIYMRENVRVLVGGAALLRCAVCCNFESRICHSEGCSLHRNLTRTRTFRITHYTTPCFKMEN